MKSMKNQISTLFILLATSSITYGAALQSMNKNQITQAVQGKTMMTVNLVTLNNKLVHNTLTTYFDEKGHMAGQLASNVDDNEPQADKGTWLVKSDGMLCATWEHWNQHNPVCIYAYELNNGILFINKDTRNFESLVLKANIQPGNKLLPYLS